MSYAMQADRDLSDDHHRYQAPVDIRSIDFDDLLVRVGRGALEDRQYTLLVGRREGRDMPIYYSGALELLDGPAVSIVGTRNVSNEGRARAARLARELALAGITVVSGLAKGVDAAAHVATIEAGGATVGVIGTPIDKAYPVENASLQETIYRDHLLLSQFPIGERTYQSNFPKRNRVMAALTDATVIVEASDTSGTLHQARECAELGRWLFIMKSVADDPALSWPKKFIGKGKVAVLSSTADILNAIQRT